MCGNTFTSDRRGMRTHSIQDYHRKRDAELQTKRDQDAADKKRVYEEALDIANYPALSTTISPISVISTVISTSYADQIKKEYVDESLVTPVDRDIANLKPGWVLLRHEPGCGIQQYKYPAMASERDGDSDDEDGLRCRVFEALADLHESRTNDFIEQYGEDVWETIFKCPHWREDQIYLEEMEAANCPSSDEELEEGEEDME